MAHGIRLGSFFGDSFERFHALGVFGKELDFCVSRDESAVVFPQKIVYIA